MARRNLHGLSVKRTLLLVLLPGMLLVVAGELWLTWRTVVDAANAAYDRSLFGAIKAIDANVSTASGGIGVELPYRMLEFFQLTASGEVYFRVATEDGLAEVGSADLPLPPRPLRSGVPQFVDAVYFGDRVRVGSYARELLHPVGGRSHQRVIIQVAEGVASRDQFTRALLLDAISRDALLLGAGAVLLAAAAAWALGPLRRLHDEVRARDPQDLTPIDPAGVPADVRPLVEAVNHHVARHRELIEERRRFVDDASHQLRTPLATLNAQVGYALRETDPARLKEVLHALEQQLEDTARRTNQMLALARADAPDPPTEPLELNAFAEDVTREWWSEARTRGVDLGFEAAPRPLTVQANAGLLREALSNLLHNAIVYTPAGGHVTVQLRLRDHRAALAVTDDGPGIPPEEVRRAGERFFRGSNVTASGSGLGLAIVRSVARRLGGALEVGAGAGGHGCDAAIVLPLAAPPAAAGPGAGH